MFHQRKVFVASLLVMSPVALVELRALAVRVALSVVLHVKLQVVILMSVNYDLTHC